MEKLNFARVIVLSGVLTLLRLLCGLIISKVVAVYTGPVGMAGLGQLQNLVALINGLASSQVSQGINRYSLEYKDDFNKAKHYWRASLQFSIIACVIIVCAGGLFSKSISSFLFTTKELYWIVILALAVVPLSVINNIFLGVLNGLGGYYRFFLANGRAIVSSVISMSILVYFLGMKGALIVAALNSVFVGPWLVLIVYKSPWLKKDFWIGHLTSFHLSKMRNYFFMGIIGALTGLVSLIIVRTILTKEYSSDYAGYWQSVFELSEAYLAVLTTALTVYYFPRTAAAKSVSEYISVLRSGCIIVVPFATFFVVSIFIGKEYILKILFSHDFIRARPLFLFQDIGDVFRISSWLFATILSAKEYFQTSVILEITFPFMSLLLTLLCIRHPSFTGVSIAYCITYIGYFLITAIVYFYHIKKIKVQECKY